MGKIKEMLKMQTAMFFIALIAILLFGLATFALPWYVSLPLIAAASFLGYRIYKKQSGSIKKSFSENAFIVITGLAALTIILLVIYLLTHITIMGQEHISWKFLTSKPSDGLTGGGIFPAIMGTALLVIIMSIMGVPVGIITAIYLTEYAKENSKIARAIRFAVNTLAGVPAIVFGLFGLGFFIGVVGKQLDSIENSAKISNIRQALTESRYFKDDGEASAAEIKRILERADREYYAEQIDQTETLEEMSGAASIKIDKAMQYFERGFRPHWGQPALLWAALTMALLTLPVVIVSVEEAIRAVPKDLRAASLALGATKFATIVRVVLPGSLTGILTGGILAVSRGAGEVAPILFTGVAYFLPDLPNSLSSQFMELGYHIYVLTTQSTDVELTKPIQYATTLVLLGLTFTLNFSAIFLRSRVRSRLSKLGH